MFHSQSPSVALLQGCFIEAADAINVVTPEYYYLISGAVNNFLDHLYPEYEAKPFAYVTVSAGGLGGVRAIGHLYDITLALYVHPGSDLPVSNVTDVFDENNTCIDDIYDDGLEEFVELVIEHAEQLR